MNSVVLSQTDSVISSTTSALSIDVMVTGRPLSVSTFIIHPYDPTVVICYLIRPSDIAVCITYLISHSSSLTYNLRIFQVGCIINTKLPSCVDIIHLTSLGFHSWCSEGTRPTDSCFQGTSCENLVMYGRLYQHSRVVLYMYQTVKHINVKVSKKGCSFLSYGRLNLQNLRLPSIVQNVSLY